MNISLWLFIGRTCFGPRLESYKGGNFTKPSETKSELNRIKKANIYSLPCVFFIRIDIRNVERPDWDRNLLRWRRRCPFERQRSAFHIMIIFFGCDSNRKSKDRWFQSSFVAKLKIHQFCPRDECDIDSLCNCRNFQNKTVRSVDFRRFSVLWEGKALGFFSIWWQISHN